MRSRDTIINIRVSEKEKKKLENNAKKSGLSLSAYLRKVGLKQEIYAIPDKEFYKIYSKIVKIKNNVYKIDKDKIEQSLGIVERDFMNIYNGSNKWVIRNGDD